MFMVSGQDLDTIRDFWEDVVGLSPTTAETSRVTFIKATGENAGMAWNKLVRNWSNVYDHIQRADSRIDHQAGQTTVPPRTNIYFAPGVFTSHSEGKRRTDADVSSRSVFVLDVDVRADKMDCYDDMRECAAALRPLLDGSLISPPAYVVNSGGGFQIYWKMYAQDAVPSGKWVKLNDGFIKFILGLADSGAIDKRLVSDIRSSRSPSHVYRMPGTMNVKRGVVAKVKKLGGRLSGDDLRNFAALYAAGANAPVGLVQSHTSAEPSLDASLASTPMPEGAVWTLGDTPAYLVSDKPFAPSTDSVGNEVKMQVQDAPIDFGLLRSQCAQMAWAYDNQDKVLEPAWFLIARMIAKHYHGDDVAKRSYFHEYSKNHPNYDPAETDKKFGYALADDKVGGVRVDTLCEALGDAQRARCTGCVFQNDCHVLNAGRQPRLLHAVPARSIPSAFSGGAIVLNFDPDVPPPPVSNPHYMVTTSSKSTTLVQACSALTLSAIKARTVGKTSRVDCAVFKLRSKLDSNEVCEIEVPHEMLLSGPKMLNYLTGCEVFHYNDACRLKVQTYVFNIYTTNTAVKSQEVVDNVGWQGDGTCIVGDSRVGHDGSITHVKLGENVESFYSAMRPETPVELTPVSDAQALEILHWYVEPEIHHNVRATFVFTLASMLLKPLGYEGLSVYAYGNTGRGKSQAVSVGAWAFGVKRDFSLPQTSTTRATEALSSTYVGMPVSVDDLTSIEPEEFRSRIIGSTAKTASMKLNRSGKGTAAGNYARSGILWFSSNLPMATFLPPMKTEAMRAVDARVIHVDWTGDKRWRKTLSDPAQEAALKAKWASRTNDKFDSCAGVVGIHFIREFLTNAAHYKQMATAIVGNSEQADERVKEKFFAATEIVHAILKKIAGVDYSDWREPGKCEIKGSSSDVVNSHMQDEVRRLIQNYRSSMDVAMENDGAAIPPTHSRMGYSTGHPGRRFGYAVGVKPGTPRYTHIPVESLVRWSSDYARRNGTAPVTAESIRSSAAALGYTVKLCDTYATYPVQVPGTATEVLEIMG